MQKSASIQPRTSLVKFARSPRTDPPGLLLATPTKEEEAAKEAETKAAEKKASAGSGLFGRFRKKKEAKTEDSEAKTEDSAEKTEDSE